MIIELSLTMVPTGITQEQWDVFWKDSLRMLQEFPIPLVRLIEYQSDYGLLRILSNNIVDSDKNGEYYTISGDAVSFILGEDVKIYRNIEYYKQKWHNTDTNLRDPFYCTTKDYSDIDQITPNLTGVNVFKSVTNGYPYHFAITGLIMLCEYLLAGRCVGWDQLRPKECVEIKRWLSRFFNEDIPLPICVDASRLWNRIEGVCGDIKLTTKRFKERFIGTKPQEIHRLLAESREVTMRELAEDLLNFDHINIADSVDIAESFLEATNDLEMYLDLIEFRNSLANANNNDPTNRKIPIFTMESVLQMLIMHHVTTTKWQSEELEDFKRWINMDGNNTISTHISFIKALVPRKFEFYCSKSELLETFFNKEPANRDKLNEAAEEAFKKAELNLEKICEMVRGIKAKADEVFPPGREGVVLPTKEEDVFKFLVKTDAHVQARTFDPIINKDIINVAKQTSSIIPIINNFRFGFDPDDVLKDSSGNTQKNLIANLIIDYAFPILDDIWEKIVKSNDNTFLSFIAIIMTAALTTKEYSRLLPIVIQLVNQTKFWNLFKESVISSSRNRR
jgi:hypothetical protein